MKSIQDLPWIASKIMTPDDNADKNDNRVEWYGLLWPATGAQTHVGMNRLLSDQEQAWERRRQVRDSQCLGRIL